MVMLLTRCPGVHVIQAQPLVPGQAVGSVHPGGAAAPRASCLARGGEGRVVVEGCHEGERGRPSLPACSRRGPHSPPLPAPVSQRGQGLRLSLCLCPVPAPWQESARGRRTAYPREASMRRRGRAEGHPTIPHAPSGPLAFVRIAPPWFSPCTATPLVFQACVKHGGRDGRLLPLSLPGRQPQVQGGSAIGMSLAHGLGSCALVRLWCLASGGSAWAATFRAPAIGSSSDSFLSSPRSHEGALGSAAARPGECLPSLVSLLVSPLVPSLHPSPALSARGHLSGRSARNFGASFASLPLRRGARRVCPRDSDGSQCVKAQASAELTVLPLTPPALSAALPPPPLAATEGAKVLSSGAVTALRGQA